MSEHHSSGSASNLPADASGAGVSREGWAAVNRPVFWIASSAIFLINAFLSFLQGQWGLAGLEMATGILALVAAAASAAESRRRPRLMGRVAPAPDVTSPHGPGQAERSSPGGE